jgi:hypothetical protein
MVFSVSVRASSFKKTFREYEKIEVRTIETINQRVAVFIFVAGKSELANYK